MLQLRSVARVYSYTRFSTPEQAAGDSYRRQMEAAQAYAKAHGMVLDQSLVISDLGVSAYQGANLEAQAGLGKFMEAMEKGLVEPGSVLLLESLDRLSRAKARRAIRVLEDIVDAGVTVVTLANGRKYTQERLDNDPFALIEALLTAQRAHEESAMKGRRVAAAWAEKRRKVRAGEAKRLTKKGPAWLRAEGDWWAVDEAKAETVRRVYAMTLEGVGEHKIAETFNGEGVPVLGRGKQWHRTSVSKLLRNRAVIGQLVPGHIEHRDGRKVRVLEEPIEGAFPAIVEKADWLAVRAMKDGHAPAVRGKGAKQPLRNVLGGLAKCPICGSAMTRVYKGKRKKAGKPKLVCTRAKSGAGCQYHSVPLDEVEEAVVDKAAWLVENIPAGDRGGELDAEAEQLQGTIRGLEMHLDDLRDAVKRSGPSKVAAERLAQIGAELDTTKADLEAVEERRRCVDHGLVRERAYSFANAAQEFDGEHREALNAALKVLFEGVKVDYRNGELVFHWRQGGETAVPYSFAFQKEDGWEAPLDVAAE